MTRLDKLAAEIVLWKDENPDVSLVFTNGCFDVLHVGHVRLLEFCALSRFLSKEREGVDTTESAVFVGLNSDESVRRLKGVGRPINSQDDRKEVLYALMNVSRVEIFYEDTPLELIKAIRPDVLVKGGDYAGKNIVGADFVESYGGKVMIFPTVIGKSSTETLKKMEAGYGD